MPDTFFTAAWAGSASFKTGTAAQTDIPMLSGSGFARNTPIGAPMLAQGAAGNAYPINYVTGRPTSALSISTYAFTTWCNPTFLASAFGLTRDATGDYPYYDVKYIPFATASELDVGKFVSLNISAAADSPVACSLGYMGLGDTSGTASFSAATAVSGKPITFCDVTVSFGSGTAAVSSATLVHSFNLSINTGAHYAAVFDGDCTSASGIDPGIMGGALSIVQRPGATNRIASGEYGTFKIGLGTACYITVMARRVSLGRAIDTNGAALDVTNWLIVSANGNAPIAVASS